MYRSPAPPDPRNGTGCTTASTTFFFIRLGFPAGEALLRGMINAASVVQGVGAQTRLLTRAEIEEWYTKKPADFQATAI